MFLIKSAFGIDQLCHLALGESISLLHAGLIHYNQEAGEAGSIDEFETLTSLRLDSGMCHRLFLSRTDKRLETENLKNIEMLIGFK